jgi:large subunit ribosomal protein L15e
MGYLKYVRDLWKKPKANIKGLMRERLLEWRRDATTKRIEHPTRPDRARSLGYKAKQGFILVRQRVPRGGHKRQKDFRGRRPKRTKLRMDLKLSYQTIAEQRANRKYPNCEVLNSYWVAKDGLYYWYEIILIDTASPAIKKNPKMAWITAKHQKGRVHRGLTSSGRKNRGLLHKGKGAEKLRPGRGSKKNN